MNVDAAAASSGASNLGAQNAATAPEQTLSGETSIGSHGTDSQVADPSSRLTLGWFLKRAVIGIAILVVSIGGMAWLTHASIDPSQEIEEAGESILKSIARAADKLL